MVVSKSLWDLTLPDINLFPRWREKGSQGEPVTKTSTLPSALLWQAASFEHMRHADPLSWLSIVSNTWSNLPGWLDKKKSR